MDLETIESQHIVDRYVQGTLSDSERDEFEILMLENPSLAEDVEYARGMLRGMRASEGALNPAGGTSSDQGVSGFWRTLAIAASALLVVSAGWIGLQASAPSVSLDENYENVIRLETLRSSDEMVATAVDGQPITIEIDVDENASSVFQLRISQDEGAFDLILSNIKSIDGLISLRIIDAPQGRYHVSVLSSNQADTAREYTFQLKSEL